MALSGLFRVRFRSGSQPTSRQCTKNILMEIALHHCKGFQVPVRRNGMQARRARANKIAFRARRACAATLCNYPYCEYSNVMSATTTTEEPAPPQIKDEEKSYDEMLYLLPEETGNPEPPLPPPRKPALSRKFWFSSAVNASSTAAIVGLKASAVLEHRLTIGTDLREQTHPLRPIAPALPGHICRLPLPSHGTPPLRYLAAIASTLSREACAAHTSSPIGAGHDLQRRSAERFARVFQHPVLPGRPGLTDTHRRYAELHAHPGHDTDQGCANSGTRLRWRGDRQLLGHAAGGKWEGERDVADWSGLRFHGSVRQCAVYCAHWSVSQAAGLHEHAVAAEPGAGQCVLDAVCHPVLG